MTIKLEVGTDGNAGYYGDTIPDVEVEISGLVNEKMSLKALIGAYVLPALQEDVMHIVDRSRHRSWNRIVGQELSKHESGR